MAYHFMSRFGSQSVIFGKNNIRSRQMHIPTKYGYIPLYIVPMGTFVIEDAINTHTATGGMTIPIMMVTMSTIPNQIGS
jgi:hypothetical protein